MTIAPNWAVTEVRPSPNYDAGRIADIVDIVIHHWGIYGQTHDKVLHTLCTGNAGGPVSAHYCVSGGRITQLVSDRDTAYHCRGHNAPSIGIECRPECSPQDFESVATLIAAIRSEWGPLPLRGHCDYLATACPGRYYPRLAELSARADAILAAHNSGAPVPALVESWRLDVDGVWGAKTGARFREVMRLPKTCPWDQACKALQYFLTWAMDAYKLKAAIGEDKLDVDGVDGPKTIKAFQAWWNQSGIPEGHRIALTGVWDKPTYEAMQIALNHSWAGSRGLACRP